MHYISQKKLEKLSPTESIFQSTSLKQGASRTAPPVLAPFNEKKEMCFDLKCSLRGYIRNALSALAF